MSEIFDVAAAIVFVSVVIISLILKERLYPFSTLGMFSYPYRKQRILLFRDKASQQILPAPKLVGSTTSAVSAEFNLHLANQKPVTEFFRAWESQIPDELNGSLENCDICLRTISVDSTGVVDISEEVIL